MGRFKNFVRGEVNLQVTSLEIEKFINMATKSKIRMWDVKRENFTTINFCMYQDQYKFLKKIVRKTGSRTKIKRKNGISFIINKINKRKFFLMGALIFLILIFIFSSMILRIEIVGNRNVNNKTIIDALDRYGITYGKLKYGYDLRDIESKVLKDINEVSVVTIKFIGTKAIVNVIERTMPPKIDIIDTPRDIISTKEGVISKITTLKGQGAVTIGDYVKKGDVLISGVVKDAEGIPLKVTEANGKVEAKTWYEIEETIDYDYKEEKLTGKEITHTYFKFYNKTLSLNNKIKFKKYDKIKHVKKLEILGYTMPIEEITEIYKEKVTISRKITDKEAEKILKDKINKKSKSTLPIKGKILEIQDFKESTDTGLKLKFIYIVEESIGLEKDITNVPNLEETTKNKLDK